MYCRQCGQQISDSAGFCHKCGTPVIPAAQQNPLTQPEVAAQPQVATQPQPIDYAPQSPQKVKSKKKLMTILIVAGAVVVCAVVAVLIIIGGLNQRYETAMSLMDSGDLAEAQAEFTSLGGYKDSADLSEECQNMSDYNAAKAKMDAGQYEEAKTLFLALGGFDDADDMAKECQNTLDYDNAKALMESGSIEDAQKAFSALGSFKDAAQMATDCQNQLDYANAVSLMDAGQFEQAKAAFTALGEYSDAAVMSVECQNRSDYAAAETAFGAGSYYEAYQMFSALGSYSDSADRALACIQPNPDNSELYRNPDYGKKSCSLTLKAGNSGDNMYIKIYTTDTNVLVSTVFINSGGKTKVKLPVGSYRVKVAYGYNWFGETDKFGNEGYYEVLIFEDGTDVYTLSSSYLYTLEFQLTEGGNVGGQTEDPETF